MNKYLMMCAAGLLSGTAGATGANAFTFGSAGGTPYCDGGALHSAGGKANAWEHEFSQTCDHPGISYGQGMLGKVQGVGKKVVVLSDNYYAAIGHNSTSVGYTLHEGAKPGSAWTMWVEYNGTSAFEASSGILLRDQPAQYGRGKPMPSTVAQVENLVRVHKSRAKS